MNKTWTDITIIIDKSGSMNSVVEATISGFNQFIAEQKKLENVHQTLTLIQFDDQYEVSYVGKPIAEVPELNTHSYIPRGSTALYDAIGKAIATVTSESIALSASPDKFLFVIITDGYDNCSKEWTKAKIKEVIENKQKGNWSFIFMGANIDTATESAGLGMSVNNSMPYNATSKGVNEAFTVLSRGTANYSVSNEVSTSSFFSPQKENTMPAINPRVLKMEIKK